MLRVLQQMPKALQWALLVFLTGALAASMSIACVTYALVLLTKKPPAVRYRLPVGVGLASAPCFPLIIQGRTHAQWACGRGEVVVLVYV